MEAQCIQLKCLSVGDEPEVPLMNSLTEMDSYIFVDNIKDAQILGVDTSSKTSDPYSAVDEVAVVLVLLNVSYMPIHWSSCSMLLIQTEQGSLYERY